MTNYNLTNLTNANNIGEIYVALDSLTNGLMSILILLVIFIISYLNISATEYHRKLMGASFITTIIGGLFWFAGLVPMYVASVSVSILLLSLVYEAFQ